jgi:uncharacterized protein YfaS (alpha-2-macroglobulin family)
MKHLPAPDSIIAAAAAAITIAFAAILVSGSAAPSESQPLPTVAALPSPSLPPWILQISPNGSIETLSQIRIRFSKAVIPLEAAESADEKAKLALFSITPVLPGVFRFVTPRMVVFETDKAIPIATRVRITMKAGLADLYGDRLDQDLSWTFETVPLAITTPDPDGVWELQPNIPITANTAVDLDSLRSRTRLTDKVTGLDVPLDVEPVPEQRSWYWPYGSERRAYDPSIDSYGYTMTPKQSLVKNRAYHLDIAPGLWPLFGNIAGDQDYANTYRTFAPLAFRSLGMIGGAVIDEDSEQRASLRFDGGTARLEFNNPLDADSARAYITISPEPEHDSEPDKLLETNTGSDVVIIDPWALTPRTHYRVTIGPGLKDVWGQRLGQYEQADFTTGDIAADYSIVSGERTFPETLHLKIPANVLTLPDDRFLAASARVRPDVLDYSAFDFGEYDPWGWQSWGWQGQKLRSLPPVLSWPSVVIRGTRNRQTAIDFGLAQRLGTKYGILDYGMTAMIPGTTYDAPDNLVKAYGRVDVTNLGLFVEVMPHEAIAFVHQLSDGTPVGGARVEIYLLRNGEPADYAAAPAPCASGTTDASGELLLDADSVASCAPWHEVKKGLDISGPRFVAVAQNGDDLAYAQFGVGQNYAGSLGWDDSPIDSRGSLFSDRGLYQPGEKASFAGYAFYLLDGVLKRDQGTRYALSLTQPDGSIRDLGSRTTNEYGTFEVDTMLPDRSPVGDYELSARSPSGVELDCGFRVAEFKAPNFKVSLSVDKSIAFAGDTVHAIGQNDYLFGRPLDGGKTRVVATRQQTGFAPPGWRDFSFGREWWPFAAPTPDPKVIDAKGLTDAHGRSVQAVAVSADLPFPMVYDVELTTTDASNLAVASSTSFTALPSPLFIGIRASYVAPAAKPLTVNAIVTDVQGVPIAGKTLQIVLTRIDWDATSRGYVARVESSTTVTSASEPVDASLTPAAPGWYRIGVDIAGAPTHIAQSDRDVWVYGPGPVNWGGGNQTNFDLSMDKSGYEPGDTATVLLRSPYAEADLYLAVIRHGTLFRTFEHVSGGAPTVTFTVTPDMLPGAAIQAVLIRRGPPIETLKPGGVDSLVRFASAELVVNLDRKYLKVAVTPKSATLAPADSQTLDLRLTDSDGEAVRGQFTVMVADESILQLNGYRLPDLVQAVYGGWPRSAVWADNRPNADLVQPVADQLDQEGWWRGFGGGFRSMATSDVYSVGGSAKVLGHISLARGAAPGAVRINFQQLAYFNAEVESDADGHASVTFKTPDNLTTWEVMVVAEGAVSADASAAPPDYRFGSGSTSFITTKPLLANPLLPQFARPGDLFEGGLETNNATGTSGRLTIDGVLAGVISFDENGILSRTLSLAVDSAAGTAAFRFPMRAGPVGGATAEFHIALGAANDAFRVPFDVLPLDLTESVVETGATTTSATIPLNVSPDVFDDAGGLDISMASTLLPEILTPARTCFAFDYLPFAEPLSSRLLAASDMEILAEKYGQSVMGIDPKTEADEAMTDLSKLQRPDGGFAWWPGATESDPYLTPYAAEALGRATEAGLKPDPAILAAAKSYLSERVEDPDPYGWCYGWQPCVERLRLEALMGLASLGDARDTHMADIYAVRDHFDLVAQIELARYMTAFPEWRPQAAEMADKFQELVYETGRYATLNAPQDYWWWDPPVKGQAEVVRLYVAQRYSVEIIDRMVRSLLALRRKGTWENTYEDAQALDALVDYAALEPSPPNFKATALLSGSEVASAAFLGYKNSVAESMVPTASLPRNRSDLKLFKRGTGTLHYVVTYSYRLRGPQPGSESGMLVTRAVRAAGAPSDIASMGLTRPPLPFSLPVGKVFDVDVTITVDHPVNQVVIVDPLPGGLEAVDTQFDTTPRADVAGSSSWAIDFQAIYRDRVVAFADYLPPGVYELHYLVRSVTPGTFEWPGTEAFLEYAPEEFGRSASSTAIIK